MQIVLVREKQFFLWGQGRWEKEKKEEKKKRKASESLICSFIPTANHINIFGETITDHHLQGS